MKLYPKVARLWSLVFLVVGLSFLLTPEKVVVFLNWNAKLLFLPGNVEAPTNNLWYVLALSLMVVITLLADASAKKPELKELFFILMASKITSTIVFFVFSYQLGSVWFICALSDAFVALTLWISHLEKFNPKEGAGAERKTSEVQID